MAAIRVLIVLDGGRFSFADASTSEENYTISFMLKTMAANPALSITTAHRRTDPVLKLGGYKPALGKAVDFENFNFATSVLLTNFDVLWLIGDEGVGPSPGPSTPISDDENVAIAAFMEDGGGVYATGDHQGIGSQMCGRLPRVRTMRRWYDGHGDQPMDIPPGWKPNWPATGPLRADTTQMGPGTDYYFNGQSDAIPQPLTLPFGTHPVLRGPLGPITHFPDHMHEGEAINPWDYTLTVKFSGADPIVEYPTVAFWQEPAVVIATGQVIGGHTSLVEIDGTYMGHSGRTDNDKTQGKTIGILSAYDGWKAGVGRVLTDSSFHHIIDLNLIGNPLGGDFDVAMNVASHLGFTTKAGAPVLADMHAFFNNAAQWLARSPRVLTLLVDKSTFGWDEVSARPGGVFERAVFVVADGLKPSDFFHGPIDEIIDPTAPTAAQLAKLALWAPSVSTPNPSLVFTPTGVTSDDPLLNPRVQRFTFTYRLTFSDMSVFLFPGSTEILNVIAALSAAPDPQVGWAQIELIKDADPYFSNYANGNTTGWLSSDLRVLKVVQGEAPFGMPLGPSPADARAFIAHAIDHMTSATFDALPTDENASALSLVSKTLGAKSVFNFALARVRLQGSSLPADPVRVFFRVFQSPTTASLTYQTDLAGNPILGYRQAASGGGGGHKIALVGISGDGKDYTSIPCFAAPRVFNTALANNMTTQTDPKNVRAMAPAGTEQQFFYGAWLDTNQAAPGLFPHSPFGQPNTDGPFVGTLEPILTSLLAGVHQCLVAEIVFDGSPILPYSTPSNSDKLAQRNIAYSTVANPGTGSSRTATHSFEIRPTPAAHEDRPDELMIDWGNLPSGTTASIYLPAVSADDVIAAADKLYANHGLKALDANTLALAVGGITYMPIPKSGGLANYAGLFSLELPAGIVKGQRFDIAVRQLTLKSLQAPELVAPHRPAKHAARIKAAHDAALKFSASPSWQTVYGAFQIAIPVSTKADMLVPESRTLSVLRWIGATLSANSRWYAVFDRYLSTLEGRVRGLGGDPDAIPATPDGVWPALLGDAATLVSASSAPADGRAVPHGSTGKIEALVFDRFGDFDGFVLETEKGDRRRYDSREARVLALLRRALEARMTVTVFAPPEHPRRPLEIALHGGGGEES